MFGMFFEAQCISGGELQKHEIGFRKTI